MDYKHHWSIDASAWYMKLYVWVWEGDLDKVDFCRLFWAYLFMPLGVLLRLTVIPFTKILVKSIDSKQQKRIIKKREEIRRLATEPMRVSPPKPKKEPSLVMQKLLENIEYVAAKVSMAAHSTSGFFKGIKNFCKKRSYMLVYVVRSIMILTAIAFPAAVGYTIYLTIIFWHTTRWLLGGIGAFLVIMSLLTGIIALVQKIDLVYKVDRWLKKHMPTILDIIKNFFYWLKRKMKPFRKSIRDLTEIMHQGYVSVKTNTCPKVEITNAHSNNRQSRQESTATGKV